MVPPVIVDPSTYDKQEAVAAALALCTAFLDQNGFKRPTRYLWEPDDTLDLPWKRNQWNDRGWSWNGMVFVNLRKSLKPVKTPGYQWSFTGYKADMTAPGVLAHEVGHHIMDTLVSRPTLQDDLRRMRRAELAVSSYEPVLSELWAEAARLMILNPRLLYEGRPLRFWTLLRYGLVPVHNTPWEVILGNAHVKLTQAVRSWISKNSSRVEGEKVRDEFFEEVGDERAQALCNLGWS